MGKRWRGKIENGILTDEVMNDTDGGYVAWNKMYRIMMEDYSDGGTLQKAIEKYLIRVCHADYNDIQKVKEILLD